MRLSPTFLPSPLAMRIALGRISSVLLGSLAILILAGNRPLPAQNPAPPAQAQASSSAGISGFYQHPTLRGSTLVFAAEGDLWTVPATGGLARRLTSHPAEESHPILSPDGQTVAFSARYEGTTDVYTMPISGGLPTRRTWEGETSTATTWTPDGDLVYTTTKYSGIPKLQMVQLHLADQTRTLIPLAGASEGAFNASGNTLYFVATG